MEPDVEPDVEPPVGLPDVPASVEVMTVHSQLRSLAHSAHCASCSHGRFAHCILVSPFVTVRTLVQRSLKTQHCSIVSSAHGLSAHVLVKLLYMHCPLHRRGSVTIGHGLSRHADAVSAQWHLGDRLHMTAASRVMHGFDMHMPESVRWQRARSHDMPSMRSHAWGTHILPSVLMSHTSLGQVSLVNIAHGFGAQKLAPCTQRSAGHTPVSVPYVHDAAAHLFFMPSHMHSSTLHAARPSVAHTGGWHRFVLLFQRQRSYGHVSSLSWLMHVVRVHDDAPAVVPAAAAVKVHDGCASHMDLFVAKPWHGTSMHKLSAA